MFRAVGIVSALIFVCTLHEAKAAVEPVTVRPSLLRPQKPLYEQERIVPCLYRRADGDDHQYYLEGPGGQRIPVWYEAIRKRC